MFIKSHHIFALPFADEQEGAFCQEALESRRAYLGEVMHACTLFMAVFYPFLNWFAGCDLWTIYFLTCTHAVFFIWLMAARLTKRDLIRHTYWVNVFCFVSIAISLNHQTSAGLIQLNGLSFCIQGGLWLLMLPYHNRRLDGSVAFLLITGTSVFWGLESRSFWIIGLTSVALLSSSINRILYHEARHQLMQKYRGIHASTRMFAHDIQGVLNLARGLVSMVSKDDLSTIRHDATALAKELHVAESAASTAVAEIISKRISKQHISGIEFKKSLEELTDQARRLLRSTQQNLQTTFNHTLSIEGDLALLMRAVLNLMNNALEANRGVGVVRLTSDDLDDGSEKKIALRVFNDGSFIQPEDLNQIFRLGFTRKPQGSGIGLAFVERVIRGHGGVVSAQSAENRGTEFLILLPALETSNERYESNWEQILLVEDNIYIVENWRAKHPNLKFRVFSTPEDLLLSEDLAGIDSGTLVITDYYFDQSAMTGLDLAKQVKKQSSVKVGLSSFYDFTEADLGSDVDFILGKESFVLPLRH